MMTIMMMMIMMIMVLMVMIMIMMMMIIWEEFCDGGTMCNVDTGGSPDNEANSPTLNLYDQQDPHHNEDDHGVNDHDEDDHDIGKLSKKKHGIIWEFFPTFPISKTFVN